MGRKPPQPDNFDFPNFLSLILDEISRSRYPCVLLVNAMNFCPWPDEIQPTELHRSRKKLGALSLLSLSLHGQNRKNKLFLP